jgi:hypothetical protein
MSKLWFRIIGILWFVWSVIQLATGCDIGALFSLLAAILCQLWSMDSNKN